MNLSRLFFKSMVMAGCWHGQSLPANLTSGNNPYSPIAARNIFGLMPIPTNPPVNAALIAPPAKITPNGIITIFGGAQVLFKVLSSPVPGQPASSEQSYILGEGESQDGIEVQKINMESAIIIFDNHGTIQELPLITGNSPADGQAVTTGVSSSTTRLPNGFVPLWQRVHRRNLPDGSVPDGPPGIGSATPAATGGPSSEPVLSGAQANSSGETPP
jgi:hypothetical protein